MKSANLFDDVYRASFFERGDKRGITLVDHPQMLRRHLRDARKFTLDDAMSSFLVDLSSAAFMKYDNDRPIKKAAYRLVDQMRIQARLPHALTWVEYNFISASNRAKELGRNSWYQDSGDQIRTARQGWLLNQHPTNENCFRCQVFENVNGLGLVASPFAFTWVTDDQWTPWPEPDSDTTFVSLSEHCAGIVGYRNNRCSITPSAYFENDLTNEQVQILFQDFMRIHSATLRRVWALFATINDIPVKMDSIVPAKGFMARGNYYRFLEHKTIHLDVLNKTDVRKLARDVVAIARRRAHQVRGHWRNDWRYPLALLCEHEFDAHMTCKRCHGRQLWVHEHQRGDASLGFVMHDYEVHVAADGVRT